MWSGLSRRRALNAGGLGTENPACTRPLRRYDSPESGAITARPRRTVYPVSPTGPPLSALGDAEVDDRTEHQHNKARNRLRSMVFMVSPAGFEPATPGLEEPHSGVYSVAPMPRSPCLSTNSGLRVSTLSLSKYPFHGFVVTPW